MNAGMPSLTSQNGFMLVLRTDHIWNRNGRVCRTTSRSVFVRLRDLHLEATSNDFSIRVKLNLLAMDC
jgi:hypothetical protein